MTISEDTRIDKQPDQEMKEAVLKKIGGFDLLARHPVIGRKKNLFIVSGRNVRSYSTENGSFLEEYSFGNQSSIIAIQENPTDQNELIVVSERGGIVHWNLEENIKSQESFLKLRTDSVLTSFQQIDSKYYFTILQNGPKGGKSAQLFYCAKNKLNTLMAINNADRVNTKATYESVAFGPTTKPEYCATLHGKNMYVYQIPVKVNSARQVHPMNHRKNFVCLAFHPTDALIATGDSVGQITLWNDILSPSPIRKIMHWHSQQVNDLAFSPNGTFLYSVGNEKVLVKWNLVGQYAGEKSFLPRLGAPIKRVVVSKAMILTSLADQTLQVLDSQMNGVRATIEGLTIDLSATDTLTGGLHYNPRLGALVLNGRVGHVQLYSPSTQKQLFQLDITEQNVVSSISVQSYRDRVAKPELTKIFPIEVSQIAVSEDGNWMATVEWRDDTETLPEIRLKFWQLFKSSFTLNTTIHLPHQEKIVFIAFSPVSSETGGLHLVSTAMDRTFKVWDLNEDTTKKWWNSARSASLNSLAVPRMAAFSSDLSLLAVLFDNIITLWELDAPSTIRYIPRMDIFELQKTEPVIYLGFGSDAYSHYLIEGRQERVTVRNILKKFETVFTHSNASSLTEDKWTSMCFNGYENVLALTSLAAIEFLSLSTGSVLLTVACSAQPGQMLVNSFTPEVPKGSNAGLPLKRSSFYCMNERQELFQVVSEEEGAFNAKTVTMLGADDVQKTKLYMQHVQSELSLLLGKKSKKKAETEEALPGGGSLHYNANFAKNRKLLVEKYFSNVPSHVLPPLGMIEKSFLASYMQCLNLTSDPEARETEGM